MELTILLRNLAFKCADVKLGRTEALAHVVMEFMGDPPSLRLLRFQNSLGDLTKQIFRPPALHDSPKLDADLCHHIQKLIVGFLQKIRKKFKHRDNVRPDENRKGESAPDSHFGARLFAEEI